MGTFNITSNLPQPVFVNAESLTIGDYGITDKVTADITIEIDETIVIENIVTTLSIRDLSIPISQMTDTRAVSNDPIVNIPSNYGLLIDGSVNPVQYGLLRLNGHDRFDRREGAYFNYVQPEIHHSNTPADGINVFSFALFPEQHQPSGAANLSRIDSTELTLWVSDSTFRTGLPEFNLFIDSNRLYIFGVNYNILRIMGGFAGIAYSAV